MAASSLMSMSWGSGAASGPSMWTAFRKEAEEVYEKATQTAYNGGGATASLSSGSGAAAAQPGPEKLKQAEAPPPEPTKSSEPQRDEHRDDQRPASNNSPELPQLPKPDFDRDRDSDRDDSSAPAAEPQARGGRPGAHAGDGPGKEAPSKIRAPIDQHLQKHGVPAHEAKTIASAITPGLEKALETHGKDPGKHVMFYPKGEIAVAIESKDPTHEYAVSHKGALAISMDTLKEVHNHGVPYDGLAVVGKELGSDVKGMSDLDMLNRVGHDVVASIGKEGYPAEMVADTRQVVLQHLESTGVRNPEVSNAQALSILGDVARADNGTVAVVDENSGKSSPAGLNNLRDSLGFEPATLDQNKGSQAQQVAQNQTSSQAAPASGGEMSMS